MTAQAAPALIVVESAESIPHETPMGNMLHNEIRIVRLDASEAERLRERFGRFSSLYSSCNVGMLALQSRTIRSDLAEPFPWETFEIAPPGYSRMLCAQALGLASRRMGPMSDGIRQEYELGNAARDAAQAVETAERALADLKDAASSAYAAELKSRRIYGKAQRGEADPAKVQACRDAVLSDYGPRIDDASEAVLLARAAAHDAERAASFPRFVR